MVGFLPMLPISLSLSLSSPSEDGFPGTMAGISSDLDLAVKPGGESKKGLLGESRIGKEGLECGVLMDRLFFFLVFMSVRSGGRGSLRFEGGGDAYPDAAASSFRLSRTGRRVSLSSSSSSSDHDDEEFVVDFDLTLGSSSSLDNQNVSWSSCSSTTRSKRGFLVKTGSSSSSLLSANLRFRPPRRRCVRGGVGSEAKDAVRFRFFLELSGPDPTLGSATDCASMAEENKERSRAELACYLVK